MNPTSFIQEGRIAHFKSQAEYASMVEKLHLKVADDFFKATNGIGNTKFAKSFRLDDAPKLNKEITGLFDHFNERMYDLSEKAIGSSWSVANEATDKLMNKYLGTAEAIKKVPLRYLDHNTEALKSFVKRSDNLINLSDRVWSNASQYRDELELHLGLGILNGDSANTMSRRIRQYLNDPTALFRRVANDEGNLVLSKRAKEYDAGSGRYRSAYKNAMRVTRTETNMAYRQSDHERWNNIDFILGFEVHLSGSHPIYDICDELEGNYPKDFRFIGWHPQCFCFAVPILMNQEDFMKYLNGEDFKDPEYISDVPKGFTDYLKKHEEQIAGWKNQPYWLRDNKQVLSNGSIKGITPLQKLHDTPSPVKSVIPKPLRTASVLTDKMSKEFLNKFEVKMKGAQSAEHVAFLEKFDVQSLSDELSGISDKYSEIPKGSRSKPKVRLTFENGKFNYRFGDEVFTIERDFLIDQQTVEHTYFRVKKKYQGGGKSKEVFQSFYEQYKKAGIEKILVKANIDIGGFTWGRYGFCMDTEYAEAFLSTIIDKKVAGQFETIIADWFKSNSEPFPMNLLANNTSFKKHLLGSEWIGTIDLKNDAQRKIFEDYLFGR